MHVSGMLEEERRRRTIVTGTECREERRRKTEETILKKSESALAPASVHTYIDNRCSVIKVFSPNCHYNASRFTAC
jgi:hypothetical protein